MAIAKLDLNSLEIEDIYSAGFEDYSKIAIDIDKKMKNIMRKHMIL